MTNRKIFIQKEINRENVKVAMGEGQVGRSDVSAVVFPMIMMMTGL